MEELDGDEVLVEILGAEEKPNSNNPIREIKVESLEKQESAGSYSIDPPPAKATDIRVAQLNEDPCLGSRKKVASFKADSTPETPENNEEGEDVEYMQFTKSKQRKKIKILFVIEFSLFVCTMLVLILSSTIDKPKNKEIWKLELWKWCVLVLAIFCGRLFSEWIMYALIFLIERHFFLRKKVLYFVYSLQKIIRVFIWLGLILLTWSLLINRGVHRSRETAKVLKYITRGIASTLVVVGVWLLKVLFVKILYSSFYDQRFFDRIQEDIFHRYVLHTLSGPPLLENLGVYSQGVNNFKTMDNEGGEQKVIDVDKLQKLKQERVSAWTMRALMIETLRTSGVYTSYYTHDESEDEQKDKEITSEWEAQDAGDAIFRNIAKQGHKYIEEDDLLHFMGKDEVMQVLEMITGAAETKRIKKKTFCNWVVNVYKKHKFLVVSLNGTNRAIQDLDKFATGLTTAVLIILWLILMGIASTEVLLFISSQFLLAVFSFGTSAISTIESFIFVFMKYPFDVGDRCVIDGVQVVVEEVSILNTVFLRYDNEKIYYPNSLLATKSISNFNRSPEMSESIELDLDASTSPEKISALKAKINMYIHSKPQLWRPKLSVSVREIEDANKMKLCIYVTHRINFQNYEEKNHRRSKLVFKLKSICEEVGIKYHILPPRSTSD